MSDKSNTFKRGCGFIVSGSVFALNAFEFKEITKVHNAHLKMLLEDDETRPRGCRMTATRQHLARVLKYYQRQPSAPSLIKSRLFARTTNLLTVLTFLHFEIRYMHTRGES